MFYDGFDHYDDWKTTPPPDPEPIAYCDYCLKDLYEGDTAYKIDDSIMCEECMRASRFTVEEQ